MQPKKKLNSIKFKDKFTGDSERIENLRQITYKETEFPKPLMYEDIDRAFQDFVDNKIELKNENGERVPTFTLYSNQRFSEYSQTWRYTDENGNLLLNFKTINRENNPKGGQNQANYWNIPGNRYYKLSTKTVLSDNGEEHVEVYSMKQPMCVDLMFRVNFVTNTFEMINRFNEKINELFKSRQCYIRPNGHFIPMVLEDAADESSYSIEERKIFVQSINIKVMAYIIKPEDYKISKFPKYPKLYDPYMKVKKHKKAMVDIEEKDHMQNVEVAINITYPKTIDKVEFEYDSFAQIEQIEKTNVRQIRMSINGFPTYFEKGFKLNENDEVKVKIFRIDETQDAVVRFIGFNPKEKYDPDMILDEDVSKIPKSEIINVE